MIILKVECDECGKDINEGVNIYCQTCIEKEQAKVKELEEEIERLESDNNDLEQTIEELNDELSAAKEK